MAQADGSDFFRRTSLFWIISVCFGMTHFTWLVFFPDSFPFQVLGPYGTFCRFLVENYHDLMTKGWWAACFIHVVEAFVAFRVCRSRGITDSSSRLLWVVQTLLFGFASLGLLLKYQRPKTQ